MTTKQTFASVALALVLGAAVGRYTLPAKVVTVHDTVTKRQYVTKTVTSRVETRKPDGTDIIATSVAQTREAKQEHDTKDETTKTYSTERWGISGVAAIDLKAGTPTYGAEISYRLLGPFTVGGVGMSSGLVGVSVGIRF